MRRDLFILLLVLIISYISWRGVFYGTQYIASKLMGYKTNVCRYGIDTELIPIARERYHKQYYHEPLAPDPVFDRNMIIYECVPPLAVILVGLIGCMGIWFSNRDGRMIRSPLKWAWVFFAFYLLRTPFVMIVWFGLELFHIRYCWQVDGLLIGYAGLHPYIFSPIICVLLLVCLASALYKAVWVTLQQHRFY